MRRRNASAALSHRSRAFFMEGSYLFPGRSFMRKPISVVRAKSKKMYGLFRPRQPKHVAGKMQAISIAKRSAFLVGATGVREERPVRWRWRGLGGREGGAILALMRCSLSGARDWGEQAVFGGARGDLHGGLDLGGCRRALMWRQYLAQAAAFCSEQREAGRLSDIVGGTGFIFGR